MKIFVSLCTIPPRYAQLEATLNSLLVQSHPPEGIFVTVPEKFMRFPTQPTHIEDLENGLSRFGRNLTVRRGEKDLGSNTKIVETIKAWEGLKDHAYFIVTDDDIVYPRQMIERYLERISSEGDKVFTLFDSKDRLKIPGERVMHVQGADSYCLPPVFFKNCSSQDCLQYIEYCLERCPEAFYQDDYLVSLLFHLKKVPVEKMAPSERLYCVNLAAQMHLDPLVHERERKTMEFLRMDYTNLRATFA